MIEESVRQLHATEVIGSTYSIMALSASSMETTPRATGSKPARESVLANAPRERSVAMGGPRSMPSMLKPGECDAAAIEGSGRLGVSAGT